MCITVTQDVAKELETVLKGMDNETFLGCGYTEYVESHYAIQTRRVLLDFWSFLLEVMRDAPLMSVGSALYSFVLWAMERPEFDLSSVKIDSKKGKFACTSEYQSLYIEYKKLLEETLAFVSGNISSAVEQSRSNSLVFILDEDSPESPQPKHLPDDRKKKKKKSHAKETSDNDAAVKIRLRKDSISDASDKEGHRKTKSKKSVSAESDPSSPRLDPEKNSSSLKHKKLKVKIPTADKPELKPERASAMSPDYEPLSTQEPEAMAPEKSPSAFMPPLFASFAVKFLSLAYFRLPCKF